MSANPYPNPKHSETSAESILDWVEHNIFPMAYPAGSERAIRDEGLLSGLRAVATEIKRRIESESKKKETVFYPGGTDL